MRVNNPLIAKLDAESNPERDKPASGEQKDAAYWAEVAKNQRGDQGALGLKEAEPESVEATRQNEPKVVRVLIWLCELCLEGHGDECHTPGCALFLHSSPGHPIHKEFYEVLGSANKWFYDLYADGYHIFQKGVAFVKGIHLESQAMTLCTVHNLSGVVEGHKGCVIPKDSSAKCSQGVTVLGEDCSSADSSVVRTQPCTSENQASSAQNTHPVNKDVYDEAYELTNRIHLCTHAGTLSALMPLFSRLRAAEEALEKIENESRDFGALKLGRASMQSIYLWSRAALESIRSSATTVPPHKPSK